MPRYFFALHWPDQACDDAGGIALAGQDDAQAYARRVIRELKEGGGYDAPGLTMVVRDHTGKTIHSIRF